MSDVWPGGPAEAAGLKVGDILVSVDGQPADNVPTVNYYFRLQRLRRATSSWSCSEAAPSRRLSIAPVEERSEFDSVAAMADPEKNLVAELGIVGVEIDQRIAAAAKGLRDPYGVIVVARAAGATSDVPFLPRDIIRSLNNRPDRDAPGAPGRDARPHAGNPVTLQIQREGRLMYVLVHARVTPR